MEHLRDIENLNVTSMGQGQLFWKIYFFANIIPAKIER